ncbi:hypothetical protein RUM44_007397 [Polyplax serrata]|uniref:Uncharacterized protein n=1 Tax=Polyplax serrata TaxID=468196 RepID=A0ABR1B0P9_POLSC
MTFLAVGWQERSTAGRRQEPAHVDGPAFTTAERTYKIVTQDTVVLPCEVINLGEYTILRKVCWEEKPLALRGSSCIQNKLELKRLLLIL